MENITVSFQSVSDANPDTVKVSNLTMDVNGKNLLKNTDLLLTSGNSYTIIAPNGSGKSTLLKAISLKAIPTPVGMTVNYVSQDQEMDAKDEIPAKVVLQSHKLLCDLMKKEKELINNDTADIKELRKVQDELQFLESDSAFPRINRILHGLGFTEQMLNESSTNLSGGWKKRIALASAIFIESDLLLLDEPTNHLDLNAVIWLESYLQERYKKEESDEEKKNKKDESKKNKKKKKILVLVSHDIHFVDSVANKFITFIDKEIKITDGPYEKFKKFRQAHYDEHDRTFGIISKQLKELKNHKEKEEKLKELAKKYNPNYFTQRKEYKVSFNFGNATTLETDTIIEMKRVTFSYPNKPPLFKNANFTVKGGNRYCIVGPNGTGKTTFINLLGGSLTPNSGEVMINRRFKVATFSQHFNIEQSTPLEYLKSFRIKEEEAYALLGSAGLTRKQKQEIDSLSGGEKSRVILASIYAQQPHLVILDEPTNHLDIESIDALSEAINNYGGAVVIVTHDIRLIQETEMQLCLVEEDTIIPTNMDMDDYIDYILDEE
jgi:ATP-binding cassette subfamily F protein 1